MNAVELVKQVCKERGISIAKLERDCDFSNGYIGKVKSPSRYVAKNPLGTEFPVFKGFFFICTCKNFYNYRRFSTFVNQFRSRFGSRFLPILKQLRRRK